MKVSLRRQRLKAIQAAWAERLKAKRLHRPSPSTLSYGALFEEYTYARDMSRWYRGYGNKPTREDKT
jgi:hypothetical protein